MNKPMILNTNLLDNLFNDTFFFGAPEFGKLPAMKSDVKENEDSFTINMELPGFDKNDIEISLLNGALMVTATRKGETEEKEDDGHYICRECYSGSFERTFKVGKDLNEEDISAAFNNGILTLNVAKKQIKENDKKLIPISA